MAASPEWKVFDRDGRYMAACKDPAAAAQLVSFYGEGASIKWEHVATVWREGAESIPAAESYDTFAEIVGARVSAYLLARYEKAHGRRAS